MFALPYGTQYALWIPEPERTHAVAAGLDRLLPGARAVPRYGLQGVLPGYEHPGEDRFAFALSGKQDIRLSRNWVASDSELDRGATFAFQVDRFDEGGGATSRV